MILGLLPFFAAVLPRAIELAHDGTITAFAGFVIFGMAVGYLLGGPRRENRSVLGIETSSRHPGLALAISTASFPHQTMIIEAITLYLLISLAPSLGLTVWHGRHGAHAKA
jgi:BASS family bile acid:Na+ symporter